MAKPIITWLDSKLAPIEGGIKFSSSAEKYEPIVAETDSAKVKVFIANNFTKGKKAESVVDDAKECVLKVTAVDGSDESPVVKEGWLFAKNLRKAGGEENTEGEYTQLGIKKGVNVTLKVTAGDVSKENTISGGANDGDENGTGKYNVAPIEMYLHPILNTTANGGKNKFRTTLIYAHGAM